MFSNKHGRNLIMMRQGKTQFKTNVKKEIIKR